MGRRPEVDLRQKQWVDCTPPPSKLIHLYMTTHWMSFPVLELQSGEIDAHGGPVETMVGFLYQHTRQFHTHSRIPTGPTLMQSSRDSSQPIPRSTTIQMSVHRTGVPLAGAAVRPHDLVLVTRPYTIYQFTLDRNLHVLTTHFYRPASPIDFDPLPPNVERSTDVRLPYKSEEGVLNPARMVQNRQAAPINGG